MQVEEIVSRLQKHEPLQYILGDTEFFGMPILVDPRVLIPRPETEELVEWIIESEEANVKDEAFEWVNILDAGTGSGCIAIALAKYLRDSKVFGMDISAGALEVAEKNAHKNNVQVRWIHGDLFSDEVWGNLPDGLDIIVSNPPYVTLSEKKEMEENVLQYEPHNALFVPDEQPLLFYERLADIGEKKLKTGGYLYFEINASLGKEIYAMLQQKGYKNIILKQDMSGKNRMIKSCL